MKGPPRVPRYSPPPISWGNRSVVQRAVSLPHRSARTPPAVVWPGPPKLIQRAQALPAGKWGVKPVVFIPLPKTATIAKLRDVARLPAPNVADVKDIWALWSWAKAKGQLRFTAVAPGNVQILAVADDLAKILGQGAKVEFEKSSIGLFDQSRTILSSFRAAHDQKWRDMRQRWTNAQQLLMQDFDTQKNAGTTILNFLTARGFGGLSDKKTRMRDLGGGFHATFSVFADCNPNEVLTTRERMHVVGNMHITEELYGAANDKNPHYYHHDGFFWTANDAETAEDEKAIKGLLDFSKSEVLKICSKLLVDFESPKAPVKK